MSSCFIRGIFHKNAFICSDEIFSSKARIFCDWSENTRTVRSFNLVRLLLVKRMGANVFRQYGFLR